MSWRGNEKRRTKKDLKRKRLARGYKRGGRFRTVEVEVNDFEKDMRNKGKDKKGSRKK